MKALLGSKVGMTQVCNSQGAFTAVTVVLAGPCEVLAVRNVAQHGYHAVQLGYGNGHRKFSTTLPSGQSESHLPRKKFIREVPLTGDCQVGDQLSADFLSDIAKVDVIGVSKGRGFAGVIKRHKFSGVCASHGVKKVHRSGGSTGQSTDPGRVFKGTKMPGRLGGARVTVKSLQLFGIIPQHNLLLISGAIPGFNGGNIIVREAS